MTILSLILMFVIPFLLLKNRSLSLIKKLGPITWAYLLGIIFSLIIFSLKKLNIDITIDFSLGETLSHVAIAIAIPLLLFSVNLLEVKKLSKMVIKSFSILVISVIIISVITYFTYGRYIIGEDSAILCGMGVGLYTGGTPNLNAIGSFFTSKGFDYKLIGIANISDMIFGGIFYLFLLSICKPLLSLFLNKSDKESYMNSDIDVKNVDEINNSKINFFPLLRNTIIAVACVLLGFIINIIIWLIKGKTAGTMFNNNYLIPVIMITVTVMGIILSFNKKVNKVEGNNLVGQYMILVFSFALASSIDISSISLTFLKVFGLYTILTIGTLIIHTFISKLFKIDVDCTIVTLTAGIYGPAFVPAITNQIKNEKLTAPGLICGSLGYAIGTFLGIIISYLLILID